MAKRKFENEGVDQEPAVQEKAAVEPHAAELAIARDSFPEGKTFEFWADGPSSFVVLVDGAPRKFYR